MTVTVKLPVVDAVHDKVDVPEPPDTLLEDNVQVRPVAGLIALDSAMVPVNPSSEATVIVEVAGVPTTAETLVGLDDIVKSWIVKVTVA